MSMKIEFANKASILAAVKAVPDIFVEEFRLGLMVAGDLLVASVVEKTPVGGGSGPWGHLSNSIQAGEPFPTPRGYAVQIGTPAGYAEVIEAGRTPGGPMPPISAIAVWVWERQHLFGGDVKTKEDAKRLAYPIAKSIAKHGFKTAAQGIGTGWAMFERALKEDNEQIMHMFAEMKRRIEVRATEAMNGGQ